MAGIIIDSFGPDGSYISAFFSHSDALIHISGVLLYPRQKSILMQHECNVLSYGSGGKESTAIDASYRPFIILQRDRRSMYKIHVVMREFGQS
eukprot:scaffold25038_cov72-Skeletonema_dohrnii-CCMP3373.AAC.1